MINRFLPTAVIAMLLVLSACTERNIHRVSASPNGNFSAILVEDLGGSATDARIMSVYINSAKIRSMDKKDLVFQVDNPDSISVNWVSEKELNVRFVGGYTNTYHNLWYGVDSSNRRLTVTVKLELLELR